MISYHKQVINGKSVWILCHISKTMGILIRILINKPNRKNVLPVFLTIQASSCLGTLLDYQRTPWLVKKKHNTGKHSSPKMTKQA